MVGIIWACRPGPDRRESPTGCGLHRRTLIGRSPWAQGHVAWV